MSGENLKGILEQLKSEKVKERQSGLLSLRSAFSTDRAVAKFHIARSGESDPRAWLVVFQAVFQAVLTEKSLYTNPKKGSIATVERRLNEAASAVRWLTERTVTYMNKRVAKAVFDHLVQTMVHHGSLFLPVTADYVKALRCLVSWTPHVEHLDDNTWIRLVEMGFNVVLGDPVNDTFDDSDDSSYKLDGEDIMEVDEDELDADDTMDESEPFAGPSQSRKRRRPPASAGTPTPKSQQYSVRPRYAQVSTEQIEFVFLLSVLLGSANAPILSKNHPYIPRSILLRFQRFLDVYPNDTSLHHDYLLALSAALSHLSLNRKQWVSDFAFSSWERLVAMWGTKNKAIKENLVAVLRVLFPFMTVDQERYQGDGIWKLWHSLDGEAESRWGVDGLRLEALRLGFPDPSQSHGRRAFTAQTFSAGLGFDAHNALAWAILELQADCAEKLFQLSESGPRHSSLTGKRARRENPITSLLSKILAFNTAPIRAYRLQILLFIIDRHWSRLHADFQQKVMETLLQLVAFDDGSIQSWVFVCYAAIAHADRIPRRDSRGGTDDALGVVHSTRDRDWDSIWTHAIRRANVPPVCRAACHAASLLLNLSQAHHPNPSERPSASQPIIAFPRILADIEALAKDLDVQGPQFPYDSVCLFLSQCLKVASQDVRLYRMQLEEKVLSWLMDSWQLARLAGNTFGAGSARSAQMPFMVITDIMKLLEAICSFPKSSTLFWRTFLPECQIVLSLQDQARTQIIRDFMLCAKLPVFETSKEQTPTGLHHRTAPGESVEDRVAGPNDMDLTQPRSRERKISLFLQRGLEALAPEWEALTKDRGHPTAEVTRQSLDLAVVSLCYESTLNLNGTRPSRQNVQLACKLLSLVATSITHAKWTSSELAFVLLSLEPLWSDGQDSEKESDWEAMLPPDVGTGIKRQLLRNLQCVSQSSLAKDASKQFQRTIWKSADLQDTFASITRTFKDILASLTRNPSAPLSSSHADRDGFAPIRATPQPQSGESTSQAVESAFSRRVIEICISYLAAAPILQSSSGGSTRDKELTDLVVESAESHTSSFLLICPIFLQQVNQRTLTLSSTGLDSLLDTMGELLNDYTHSKSETMQQLAIRLLDSTSHIWLDEQIAAGDIGNKVRQLCGWLSGAARKNKFASWRVRDTLVRFLDRSMKLDPNQSIWQAVDDDEDDDNQQADMLPISLLPMMGEDEDIRVRFRAAVANARLFAAARALNFPPLELYDRIRRKLTLDLSDFERMLTRILTLGNTMVVSSAVRRGAYWHLLETCLNSDTYNTHMETILTAVARRMGLASLAQLFEAYASQIAFSICLAHYDFLRFPPHLLGYNDRKECARAAFRAFSPSNLLANGGHEVVEFGERLFRSHCKALQKSPDDGISECFADVVGYQLVYVLDQDSNFSQEDVEAALLSRARKVGDTELFGKLLLQNVDGIVAAVLRTLRDEDFAPHGSMHSAIQNASGSHVSAQTFQTLVRYRSFNDYATHPPNLPAYSSASVLRALQWLHQRIPESMTPATTFHVLYRLFAEIQDSPLVNEQMRLINAVVLWIAFHHDHFSERTLINLLAQNATSLIVQLDLAPAAQSLAEWSFSCYRKHGVADVTLPNILNRVCHAASDYASDPQQYGDLGPRLMEWIDKQAVEFCSSDPHRSLVLQALSTWSHDLSAELQDLCEAISLPALSQVLADHRVSSNKFRLVRQWITRDDIDDESFSRQDFWRFKECIPPINELKEQDIHNFVDLLIEHKGQINGFGSEHPDPSSATYFHRSRPRTSSTTLSPQQSILYALLTMLDNPNTGQVYRAYETLRLLLSSSAKQDWWTDRQIKPVEYLQNYAPTIRKPSKRDIHEMQTDPFIEPVNDFGKWIGMVTGLLSDILSRTDPFYAQLAPILESDASFSEQLLPVLVFAILKEAQADPKSSLRQQLSEYFTAVLKAEGVAARCLCSIVDTVLHLRHFAISPKDALGYNKWLEIDFTLLAQSAITCGAYTTALLFLELAAEYSDSRDERATEQILFEIYTHMDEPDGFYGIKTQNLHTFLIRRFHHEQQWDKAFQFHGAGLEAQMSDAVAADGLLRSYHSFGFNHLAISMQTPLMEAAPGAEASSMSYRLGWRTETWDLPDQGGDHSHSSLYGALRAVHRERDAARVDDVVRRSFFKEMEHLRRLGTENLAEIHEVVQNLMCLRQVSRWKDKVTLEQLCTSDEGNLKFADVDPAFEFSDLETILSTRISIVRSLRHKEERVQMGNLVSPLTRGLIDLEKRALLRLSDAARNARQKQIALNAIIRAQKLEKTSSFEVSQEFASVLWLQEEAKYAVQSLKGLLDQVKGKTGAESIDSVQEAKLLARLGSWTAEACLEKPTEILSQFFGPAAEIINSLQSTTLEPSHASVYHQCAMFADRQYQLILKSPDAERWRLYVDRKTEEIEARQKEIKECTDRVKIKSLQSEQTRANKLLANDQVLFREHNATRDAFLMQAIDMYSRCLESSDAFDSDAPIRLCSLWFANFDDNNVQDIVAKGFSRISSHKFVFLAHQLTARLSKSQAPTQPKSQTNLQSLVVRMCREHPFHSLQQVYCLQPEHPGSANGSRRQSSRQSLSQMDISPSQAERGDAAREIFDKLRTDERRGERVRALEQLCDASLQWAQLPIKDDPKYKKGHGPYQIPSHMVLTKISNFKAPVLTAAMPLDPTLEYEDCVWVERFGGQFRTAGGINLPKITWCYGSDGKEYKQLYKGEGQDDLRQDAVMEQVFELVNIVLSRDRETRRRNLGIRSYKVIPLSSQAGILEFVGNTSPLSGWLLTAHDKYRPQDISQRDAVGRLRKLRDTKPTNEGYIAGLLELRKKFKPVMRHYFTERHRMPMAWFAMRLNYTRSVATTSIVGHVLGLGDRHTSNILMDNVTGEVVHIDLGIAFEQGKLLPVPERVPFRMTPDMVDGMGTAGTQGVFQRCAEETLRVLREGSGVIMTVLEVFKHDPLHSWTASEVKMQRIQGSEVVVPDSFRAAMGIGVGVTSGVALEAADRALSSVARKLDKTLSVESTVNQLIAEATDVANLALMWPGWSIHL
ncbi:hypothetical protein HGRIS_004926 [Hohenbuehelia grisea]|uniref:Serine/threonine-protein kinase Tel1 n=1 Tax=Hohenbuehelia grisea TaxID=104357 RepID=A0ABR3JDE8_9AGAR